MLESSDESFDDIKTGTAEKATFPPNCAIIKICLGAIKKLTRVNCFLKKLWKFRIFWFPGKQNFSEIQRQFCKARIKKQLFRRKAWMT